MKRVLLIERDATLRTTFRHFLEENGYEVVDADDGSAALETCRDFRPQIVITNLSATLEHPTNRSVVSALRGEFEKLPIISISGSPEASAESEALDMGASLHLTKPVRASELVATVNHLVQTQERANGDANLTPEAG